MNFDFEKTDFIDVIGVSIERATFLVEKFGEIEKHVLDNYQEFSLPFSETDRQLKTGPIAKMALEHANNDAEKMAVIFSLDALFSRIVINASFL